MLQFENSISEKRGLEEIITFNIHMYVGKT